MTVGGEHPVAINARAAVRAEIGGVERWAREMTARLPALRPGAYRVLAPRPRLAHGAGHAWEQIALPLRAARVRARVVYSPANLAPLAWPRNVVLIHDAAALRDPRWYSSPYVAWQRRVLPAIARRAAAVVAPSEFARGEIVELLGADPDRVTVIPGGVDQRFSPAADAGTAARELGLARPYVLAVATPGARKNLGVLDLTACRLERRGVDVVVAGRGRSYVAAERLAGVRSIGYVAEEALPGLYAGALAFVLPSLYEGFGLTCVEAMASGVPVVAADRGALPETCGGAAVLVDPESAEAVADAVERAVGDEALRGRLLAAGRARAGELTWDRAARATDAVLMAAGH